MLRAGAPASFGEGACRKVQKTARTFAHRYLPQFLTFIFDVKEVFEANILIYMAIFFPVHTTSSDCCKAHAFMGWLVWDLIVNVLLQAAVVCLKQRKKYCRYQRQSINYPYSLQYSGVRRSTTLKSSKVRAKLWLKFAEPRGISRVASRQ